MKLRVLALVAFAALMVTACGKKESVSTGDTTAVVLDSLKADTTVTDSAKADTTKADSTKVDSTKVGTAKVDTAKTK